MPAYVPQYQYDIFVSYADVDNDIFPGEDHGWVTTFIRALNNVLAKEIGSKDGYSLWSHEMLPAHMYVLNKSIQYVQKSALFLLILSPAYLKSNICNSELCIFLDKVGENSDRFFVVEYKPVERPKNLSDLRGYIFWKEDLINYKKYPLHNVSDYQEYYKKITDLASDIFNKLEELKVSNISEVSEDLNVQDTELNNFITSSSPKPVEKSIESKQTPIVETDNRHWWTQLDDNWKRIFKKAIEIAVEPSNNDLETIFNLRNLNCDHNQISDLEPIRALTNLQYLSCIGNKISDLEPLRALINLQYLNCSFNQINLESLCALTNLQYLNCNNNQITDLESIHTLTNLKYLKCEFNSTSDLKPLCSLTNLQELSCIGNKITDLEPLRELTNLQELHCELNKITYLEPICALTNLQYLNCNNNQIRDLEPLRALGNLQILDCSKNQISDLKPLRALTNLQILDCSKNQISYLKPLRALTNLEELSCSENEISDLELEKLKKAMPNCEVYS
jgi:Leucine-rich repeat (LRR) protein